MIFSIGHAQVHQLQQQGLDSEYPQVLKDGLLVTGAQQLEEIFSLHTYELSFIIYIIGFGVKGYSIRNNKLGENSGNIVIIFR